LSESVAATNFRLRAIYGYEAEAQRRGFVPEERLRFHQEHSQPVMDALRACFEAQFAERKVEPNSGLREAITYCLKRWTRLTLFLRQAGAPPDASCAHPFRGRSFVFYNILALFRRF
jgi:hypothetical protein